MVLESRAFNSADNVIERTVRRGLTADRSKINPRAVSPRKSCLVGGTGDAALSCDWSRHRDRILELYLPGNLAGNAEPATRAARQLDTLRIRHDGTGEGHDRVSLMSKTYSQRDRVFAQPMILSRFASL